MTGFGIMFAVVAVFIGIVFVVVIGAIIFGLVKAGRTAAADQAVDPTCVHRAVLQRDDHLGTELFG